MGFRPQIYIPPPQEKVLWITGDPIQDIWSTGYRDTNNRWVSTESRGAPGGAANTYQNATAIGHSSGIYSFSQMRDIYPELIRLINKDGSLDTELWDYHGDLTKMCRLPGNIMRTGRNRYVPTGFVISEYNKGSCNRPTRRSLPDFEFAVVDSRYKTLDMSWLATSKIKIWHATGEEFSPVWAQNFDYVIHSSGPDSVLVKPINFGLDKTQELRVPNTKVVDTIGAGDTLTAAVGVWLLYVLKTKDTIEFQDVVRATEFGIWCCQDVITKPYTAICERTLEEYLER